LTFAEVYWNWTSRKEVGTVSKKDKNRFYYGVAMLVVAVMFTIIAFSSLSYWSLEGIIAVSLVLIGLYAYVFLNLAGREDYIPLLITLMLPIFLAVPVFALAWRINLETIIGSIILIYILYIAIKFFYNMHLAQTSLPLKSRDLPEWSSINKNLGRPNKGIIAMLLIGTYYYIFISEGKIRNEGDLIIILLFLAVPLFIIVLSIYFGKFRDIDKTYLLLEPTKKNANKAFDAITNALNHLGYAYENKEEMSLTLVMTARGPGYFKLEPSMKPLEIALQSMDRNSLMLGIFGITKDNLQIAEAIQREIGYNIIKLEVELQ